MKNNKIYIAGPRTGIKDFNFAEFDKAKICFEEKGYVVISPADIARTLSNAQNKDYSDIPKSVYMKNDIYSILACNYMYMLHGWINSEGAKLEHKIAKALKFNIIYQGATGD